MEGIEIRELNVKDIFAVARMLGKITKGARMELSSALTGKKKNPTEVGMVIFQSVFLEAEEDLKAWLADLIGKDVVEFEMMPATVLLDVIEKLAQQEGIRDFFGKASLLANKLTGKS